LNPSLDRTVELDHLAPGCVQRVTAARLDPGGKGVNVARALLSNGVPTRAVVPVAGIEGDQLVGLLEHEGVGVAVVPVLGHTRSNITIAEADGTVTKLNEPGASLGVDDLEALASQVLAAATPGSWVVLCGSLPPGLGAGAYATLTRRFVAAGLRVAVDTSGPAFRAAVAVGPDLVKPNVEELAEAVGRPLGSQSAIVAAARELQGLGAQTVLVSLGAAGAILVDETILVGASPVDEPRSSVGAGDAFLAGFLAGQYRGASRREAFAEALAWGAAAVRLPGTLMPGPNDIDRSVVHILSPAIPAVLSLSTEGES
ncbi:MAG TPA: 1-phosphofructokinase, partial [Dermatophilaceae bacterium]